MPRPKRTSSYVRGEKKSAPKITHTKRQLLEDEEGWTHVVDSPLKSKLRLKVKEGQLLHAGDFEKGGIAYVKRTMEELRTDLEYYTKAWEGSEACGLLRERLEDKAERREGRKEVSSVICLGLGSLQSARREGRRCSFTQLAALRTIIQLLRKENLRTIFQDPQFTDLDKEFLTGLGYQVVNDPEAFGMIDGGALVYAVHCYASVYGKVAEKRPVVLVGTDVENFGRFNLNETTENIAKSLQDTVKECEVEDFPQLRNDFSDTKIYWRRTPSLIEEEPVAATSPVVEKESIEAKDAPAE